MTRRILAFACALLTAASAGAAQRSAAFAASASEGTSVRHPIAIRMSDATTTVTATLNESDAAADFVSMLPLSLSVADYASTEKIAYLPRKLATEGAPPGIAPKAAMLAYYAPWGNLALFYRDAVFARGLVELGHVDGGASLLERFGPRKVLLERIE